MNRREKIANLLHAETVTNGGATLLAQSGASLSMLDGYVVGGAAGLSVVLPVDAKPASYERAVKALEAAQGSVPSLVGTWVHEQQVYVDSSNWFQNRADAVRMGRTRGELAIWDVAERIEITL